MITFNGSIRLTTKEFQSYKKDTGRTKVPKTVAEYNRHLQEAADYWRQATGEDDPVGNLLAELIEYEKVS